MTFEEVLGALINRRHIKRKCQTSHVFLHVCKDEKVRLRRGRIPINKDYGLTAEDLLATDWEIII